MNIVLGFVFLLCLLLLVMIFGEQLSVLGAFHGRWFSAVSESIADLWDFLCEEVDRVWRYVLEHLWWVLAVGSGSSGVVLIAWLMFGGIADRAVADVAGHSGRMDAGGGLDGPTELKSLAVLQNTPHGQIVYPVSHVVHQEPADHPLDLNWHLPAEREPVRENDADSEFPPFPDFTGRRFRDLDEPLPRDWGIPSTDRDRLSTLEPERGLRARRRTRSFSRLTEEYTPDDDAITQVSGTTITTGTLRDEIEAALDELKFQREDEWRRRALGSHRGLDFSNLDSQRPRIREATDEELDTVESSVNIVPGSSVGDSDLHITKRMSAAQRNREFDIEISVTNQSRRRMSGLLVHEHLPSQLRPVSIDDGGVYRNSTVTWLIDDLLPRKTQTVRVLVRSGTSRAVDTQTVISAVAAVASEIVVESDRRAEFTPGQPEVRLTMGKVPRTVRLSEKFEIPFRLSNVGAATAGELLLRIELPPGLDHFHLGKNDIDRNVVVTVRDLAPNTSRVKVLKLRATESGMQTAVVEFLENRGQKELSVFRIRVLDDDAVDTPDSQSPLPDSDDSIPFRRR